MRNNLRKILSENFKAGLMPAFLLHSEAFSLQLILF